MKKIYTELRLVNYAQLEAAAMGLIKPGKVHSVTLKGRIDTACTHLALPEEVAEQLELRKVRKTKVRYADDREDEKWLGSVVQVEINGRATSVHPVIANRATQVLVGNPILEDMDLFVNTKTGALFPNPESPDMPLAELI